ncbi:hypothetical protein [Paracraurococcus lichenis]|uniref:Uncharacterized protein n=1 Tax=Paracraurococcus lichenis TaxID=3064888 RepID=A0ABT9EB56_9PROT|nr:hypothetical protein [Paracraurococcus sp. LOR1-02]MDO9713441.1 hypothetical protein [Paracraurococcus sp. LOR1-02]
MSGLRRLTSPADFAADWWIDWAENPDPALGTVLARTGAVGEMRQRRQHPLRRDLDATGLRYALPQTAVTVNPTGPALQIRFCSMVDCNCDLFDGDGLLFAPVESEGLPDPEQAPIRLAFSEPVHALGTRAAGLGLNAATVGAAFTALLWVRRQGSRTWEAPLAATDAPGTVASAGKAGTVVFAGEATAPFLGAEVTAGPGICEARFTLSTARSLRLDAIMLAPLYGRA